MTEYYNMNYDGKEVQVESAVRDEEGYSIKGCYAKKTEIKDGTLTINTQGGSTLGTFSANQPTDTPVTITLPNGTVQLLNQSVTFDTYTPTQAEIDDGTYAEFPYRASVTVSGISSSTYAEVTYSEEQATSLNFATFCDTATDVIYLYSRTNVGTVIIPTISIGMDYSDITIDATPTSGSGNAVSSGGVYTALNDGSVSKLGTSTIGTDTKPVKWVDGVPIAVTNDLVDVANDQSVDGFKTLTKGLTINGSGGGSVSTDFVPGSDYCSIVTNGRYKQNRDTPRLYLKSTKHTRGTAPASNSNTQIYFQDNAENIDAGIISRYSTSKHERLQIFASNTYNNATVSTSIFLHANNDGTTSAVIEGQRAYVSENTTDIVTIGTMKSTRTYASFNYGEMTLTNNDQDYSLPLVSDTGYTMDTNLITKSNGVFTAKMNGIITFHIDGQLKSSTATRIGASVFLQGSRYRGATQYCTQYASFTYSESYYLPKDNTFEVKVRGIGTNTQLYGGRLSITFQAV